MKRIKMIEKYTADELVDAVNISIRTGWKLFDTHVNHIAQDDCNEFRAIMIKEVA